MSWKRTSCSAASSNICFRKHWQWRKKEVKIDPFSGGSVWRMICGTVFCARQRRPGIKHDCTGAFMAKEPAEEQARLIGDAWEKLGDPKPQFNLEIHLPNGDKIYKVLGPHAPNLTSNEVQLLHRLWLRFNEILAREELHHPTWCTLRSMKCNGRWMKATKTKS